jgi:hypothetical protein
MVQSTNPTLSHTFALYNLLLDNVESTIAEFDNDENRVLCNAAKACYEKLKEYYSKTDYNVLFVASVGNVHFNSSFKSMLQVRFL